MALTIRAFTPADRDGFAHIADPVSRERLLAAVAPYPVVGQWPLGLPMAPQLGTNAGVDTGDGLTDGVWHRD